MKINLVNGALANYINEIELGWILTSHFVDDIPYLRTTERYNSLTGQNDYIMVAETNKNQLVTVQQIFILDPEKKVHWVKYE